MLLIVGVVVLAIAVAFLAYARRGTLGPADVGLAALRATALAIVGVLVLNPSWTAHETPGPPTVLLDASLSMAAAGGQWDAALDSAAALRRQGGVAWRFGSSVAPFDTGPPRDGFSRLREALAAAHAVGRPVIVLTDGELDDGLSVPDGLLHGVSVVTLPRRQVSGAALAEVGVPPVARLTDTIPVTLTIARWGEAAGTSSAVVEVFDGDRRVASWSLELPAGSARARRTVRVPPGVLAAGERVLRFRLRVEHDGDGHDNERHRVIRMTDEPDIVVIVDPADWEGRYLARTLTEVSGGSVEAYARVTPDRWIDMRRTQPIPAERVWSAARRASLVVVRSDAVPASLERWRGALWQWPVRMDAALRPGDWYATPEVGASPLAAVLAALPWDSAPPLTGVVSVAAGGDAWVALGARQGRRGGIQPVLIGWQDGTRRRLVTTGTGVWRWALHGGISLEIYRGVVAAGVDWLLGSPAVAEARPLLAETAVAWGAPMRFRWVGGDPPDSVTLEFSGGDRVDTVDVAVDAGGRAEVTIDPGVYHWRVPGTPRAAGVVAVESYSDELAPRPRATLRTQVGSVALGRERFLRGQWWLVLVAMAALVGEWAWRQRRGFP